MKQSLKYLFFYLLTASNLAAANNTQNVETSEYQSIEKIHQLVENHVKQKIDQQLFEPEIQLRKLPHDLQLPNCQSALELIDNRIEKTAGRMTIRVLCPQPKWQVFVPVNVEGKKPLVVSAKAILKRAVITEEDVKQEYVSYKQIPTGSLVDINKAIGMRTKRAIGANQPIKVRDLQPPFWVFKNKEVNIITKIGDIEVKTKGIALKNGVVDEQVPVKNSSSEKIINGIVIAPNTVLVP